MLILCFLFPDKKNKGNFIREFILLTSKDKLAIIEEAMSKSKFEVK